MEGRAGEGCARTRTEAAALSSGRKWIGQIFRWRLIPADVCHRRGWFVSAVANMTQLKVVSLSLSFHISSSGMVFIFLECLYLFVVGNSVNWFGGLAIWFKRRSIHGVSAPVEASARSGFGFICPNEMFSLWADLTYSQVYSWFWRRHRNIICLFSKGCCSCMVWLMPNSVWIIC